jgi:16S rRNA (guanine527-N7)-methyltransferase
VTRLEDSQRALLLSVLETAKGEGALGPGPVVEHLDHALAWAAVLPTPTRFIDLGSGGGIPGLVLALAFRDARALLLDARARRTESLERSVEILGLGDRVEVHLGRAEEAGRDPALRGAFDLAVARGFGPPPATAEAAAPFLAVGGHLSVSEPPEERTERWPAAGLGLLGFAPVEFHRTADGAGFMVTRLVEACGERYPRRTGIPEKRPLW